MDFTIPLESLFIKTIESLEPRTLFFKHDGYRPGALCMRIATLGKPGTQGYVILDGPHRFEVLWLDQDHRNSPRATVLPTDQLCVTLTTDSVSDADHSHAGNLFSVGGKSYFLAKLLRSEDVQDDLYIELFSGSAAWNKPENSSLFSKWSLLSREGNGKETLLLSVSGSASPKGNA